MTMKNNSIDQYSEITSFEDFRLEKEILLLKKRLIETKIQHSFMQFSKIFTVSNLLFSISKEFILPKISDFLGVLIKKVGNEAK
jgi:hypothetical protein